MAKIGIGNRVAYGYLNRPTLTNAVRPDFLGIRGNPPGKIYSTGGPWAGV